MSEPPSSAERLALAGRRRDLNSGQHAVARDRVIKGRADMCAFTEVTCEAYIRLGEIGARALLRWRPAILLWHRQHLQGLIFPIPPMHCQFEDLGLAAHSGQLQIALSAVDFPEQVRAARDPAAVVYREGGSALEQSADAHLIIRGPGLAFARSHDREGLSAHRHGGRELADLAEAIAHGVPSVAYRSASSNPLPSGHSQ